SPPGQATLKDLNNNDGRTSGYDAKYVTRSGARRKRSNNRCLRERAVLSWARKRSSPCRKRRPARAQASRCRRHIYPKTYFYTQRKMSKARQQQSSIQVCAHWQELPEPVLIETL